MAFDFDPDTREIWIHDEIGADFRGLISTKKVREALKEMKNRDILISLNCIGGSVDEGFSIANSLRKYPGRITMVVDSLAASMASFLLCLGDERLIAPEGAIMCHPPWGACYGNADEFRQQASILEHYRDRMIPTYVEATGQPRAEIERLLSGTGEHWFDARAAVDFGFCHGIVGQSYQPQRTASVRPAELPATRVPESLGVAARTRSPRESMRRAKQMLRELDRQRREPLRRAKQSLRVCDRMSAVAARLEREEAWLIAD